MRRAHHVVVAVHAALTLVLAADAAHAQFIITGDQGWVNFPAGGAVPNPYSIHQSDGADAPFNQQLFSPAGSNTNLNRMGLRGSSSGFLFNTVTSYTFQTRWMRSFHVDENATLSLPNMLNALTGHNGTTVGRIDSRLTLQRRTGPGPDDFADVSFFGWFVLGQTQNAPPSNAVIDSPWANYTTDVAPGDYRVLMTLQVAGVTLGNSAVGTVATFDQPDSRPRGGFMASIAATPQVVGDSRAAVRAPQARTDFNVSGNLINVGILEPGLLYNLHESVLTRNVNGVQTPRGIVPLLGPANPGADFRNEHTFAVASILGGGTGNAAQLGVAPGVSFVSSDARSYANGALGAFDALIANGVNIINMSALSGNISEVELDTRIANNSRLSFVKSSGNTSLSVPGNAGNTQPANSNTLTQPGQAFNLITVGALNRDFTRRADFSSFNDTNMGPGGPTLVAPGEYIQAANFIGSRGADGTPNATGFGRVFAGNDFDHLGGVSTGDISGTSFAAPHVSGTIALMHDYRAQHAADFDADSIDHKVMKAVLVNSASTHNIRHSTYLSATNTSTAGAAWAQNTNGGAGTPASPLQVRRSLDQELGGGMLDTHGAVRTFASGEVRLADNNAARTFVIDGSARLTGPNAPNGPRTFWDLETVGQRAAAGDGMVDYLLGDISGNLLRSTLTWDRLFPAGQGAGGVLPSLNLRLYLEGLDAGNVPGFDAGDMLVAETVSNITTFENVKLFSSLIPDPGAAFPLGQRNYFLEVINPSIFDWQYAVVVQIPTPAGASLLALLGIIALRRRRGA